MLYLQKPVFPRNKVNKTRLTGVKSWLSLSLLLPKAKQLFRVKPFFNIIDKTGIMRPKGVENIPYKYKKVENFRKD